MKKIATIITCIFLLSSCTMQKRHYTKGFYVSSRHHQSANKKPAESQNLVPEQMQSITASLSSEFSPAPDTLHTTIIKSHFFVSPHTNTDECDLIILRSGEEIKAKVSEITLTEVKYKKCDNQTGPTISIDKKDVFMIKYANGTKDIITTDDKLKPKEIVKSDLQTEPISVIGFVLSLLGGVFAYFVFLELGLFLLITAFILSIVGLVRIHNNKSKFKGKGFAIAGLIISLVSFIGVLVVLSFLA